MTASNKKLRASATAAVLLLAAFSLAFANGAIAIPAAAAQSSTASSSGDTGLGAGSGVWNLTSSNETAANGKVKGTNGTGIANEDAMFGAMSEMMHSFTQNHLFGMITGQQQNSSQTEPAWLLGGSWLIEFASTNTSSQNSTGTASANMTTSAQNGNGDNGLGAATGVWNLTSSNSTAANGKVKGMNGSVTDISSFFGEGPQDLSNVTGLYAMIVMVKPDGTALHTHMVSNFTQDGTATKAGNVTTITGTSTITMRDGPMTNVPTTIKIASNGTAIAMSFNEPSVSDHFANQPIYGIGITKDLIQAHMDEHQQMMSGTATSSTNSTMPMNHYGSNSTITSGNMGYGSGMR